MGDVRSRSLQLSLACSLQAEELTSGYHYSSSPLLYMTTLLNASSLPLVTLTLLFTLNVESSLFLEAYFTVQKNFSNVISNYNLEVLFSFFLINLLNKYANISSALYKKYIHTTNNPWNIKKKNKINKNMYNITYMKWPSSFETIIKLNCTSVAWHNLKRISIYKIMALPF